MINKNILKNKLAIIGLGYVGLPLLISFSRKFKVIGYDFNKLIMDNHHHVRKSLTYWFYEKPESITQ